MSSDNKNLHSFKTDIHIEQATWRELGKHDLTTRIWFLNR